MPRARRVYKLGGPALEDHSLLAPLAREVERFDGDLVLVHGGGRQIETMLKRLGVESAFVNGRRATSDAAMEVVEMVLSGGTNKALAAGLSREGVPAVGLSGRDGNLIRACLVEGLGRVGTPELVNSASLEALWAAGIKPVVSPVSNDASGQSVNVNADEAAQWIARAIGAETLVFLSDVNGVILDGAPVEQLTADMVDARVADGAIHGGMAMKVRMAIDAARSGIPSVIIAGRARLEGGFPGTRISLQ
jgi:acetylglutamate kinase